MEPNSLMFLAVGSLFVLMFAAHTLLRTYGKMMAVIGISIYCAVVMSVFLQVQVWNVDLPWGSRLAIGFFMELGILVVAVIAMFIVNEWPKKIMPSPISLEPKQRNGGVIDITTSMQGNEKVVDITQPM